MSAKETLIGTTVGNYHIVRKLGQGGMGAVYLGENPEIRSKVAIKVLLPKYVTDEAMVGRFLNEARAVNRIGHQGIVRIHDCGYQEELGVYLVMEYLEGQNLAQRCRARGKLPQEMAVRFTQQAASALEACHRAGIIHRDLKLANVFVVADEDVAGGERVKVLDFGIAKLLESAEGDGEGSETRTGLVIGSPPFMSPEQCMDSKNIDSRSDIYSLGVLLYYMLGGTYPFKADTLGKLILMHREERPTPLSTLNEEVPEELEQIIYQALEIDAEKRFQTMRQLRAALGPITGDAVTANTAEMETVIEDAGTEGAKDGTTLSGSAGQTASGPVRSTGGRWRSLLSIGVGLAAVTAAVALIVVTLQRKDPPGDTATPGAPISGAPSPAAVKSDPVPPPPKRAEAKPEPEGETRASQVQIRLDLSPRTARVLLDGKPVSTNPVVLTASSERHSFRLEADGYEAEERLIVADTSQTLVVALKEKQATTADRTNRTNKTNRRDKTGSTRVKRKPPAPGKAAPGTTVKKAVTPTAPSRPPAPKKRAKDTPFFDDKL